jgi:hypothetical protein
MNFTNILEVVIPLEPIFANLLPSDSSLYLIADLLVIFLLSAIQVGSTQKQHFLTLICAAKKEL